MTGEQVRWPAPPRDPGAWGDGLPVAPATPAGLAPRPGPESAVDPPAGNPWLSFAPPPAPTADQRAALPSSGVKAAREDRAPAWILALSGLVIAAMVVGCAYLITQGKPSYPKAWDDRVAPIADWVASARKLDFDHPVRVDFLSPAQYRAAATSDGSAGDESATDNKDSVAEMRALGLVSGDVDLSAASDTLSDTGTLAYYDQNAKRIFVRGTTMTPDLRVTLAHELTHVLQDQHFDLTRLSKLPDEQASVLRSIAEGDADRIERRYVDDVLSDSERKAYEKAQQNSDAVDEIDSKVPPSMTAFFAAPYIFGPTLVDFLYHSGQEERLDEAFEDPPPETVLFDPRLLDTPDADLQKVTLATPSGAEEIRSGYFGPIAWYLVLASRLDPKVALQAVDGLDGDRYVTFREQDKVCVKARVVAGSVRDRTEFRKALQAWSAKAPAGTVTVAEDGESTDLRACDPGTDAKPVGEASIDLLAVPVVRSTIFLSASHGGASTEQASCFAQGVIDEFTVAQLNDPNGGSSPEFTAAMDDLRARCGS